MASPTDDELDYLREASDDEERVSRYIDILTERLCRIDPEFVAVISDEFQLLKLEGG